MRSVIAIAVVVGVVLLAWVVHEPSRPNGQSSGGGELLVTNPAVEQQLPVRSPVRSTAVAQPPDKAPATNLLARLLRGDESVKLRPEEVESYLQENHRGVESLLGAFRTTHDRSYLSEAAQKYPQDPRVAYEAASLGPPEERRKWLETFKQSAPDNALANYLSAGEYFKAGQPEPALRELQAAAGKPKFQDYFGDFVQNAAEAYRAAGYSEAEAKTAATTQALLPQLAPLKQLGLSLVELAQSYRQAGDESSAQAALDMTMSLGARLNQPDSATLIQTLVGIAVQKKALGALDPAAPYGSSGETVQATLDALEQQKQGIKALAKPLEADLLATLPEADLVSFHDRLLLFGEQSALEWLMKKQNRSAGGS